MQKRLISFPPDTLKWLKREAERFEISVSEFVRRVLHEKRERDRRSK